MSYWYGVQFNANDNFDWENGTGTYVQRDHVFKSARFEFNMHTCEAWSYDWWQFVIKIGNTIYFNDAGYSPQTRQHQRMAENVIRFSMPQEYGIKVKYVYYREGLNHLDTAISNMQFQIEQLRKAIANPRSWKRVNKERRKQIQEIYKRIKFTRKFKRMVDKQRAINGDIRHELQVEQWKREEIRDEKKRAKRERALQRAMKRDQQSLAVQALPIDVIASPGAAPERRFVLLRGGE